MSSPYEDAILEHARSPRNWGRLEDATHHAEDDNPACGDHLEVWLKVDGKSIRRVGFEGEACTVARAGASLFLDTLPGLTVSSVAALGPEAVLDLFGFKLTTSRVKCATLALHAVKGALTVKVAAR